MVAESSSEGRGTSESRRQWRDWMRDFGSELRRVRKLLGLSQEELGRHAGVSQGAVSRLEAGKGLNVPLVAVLKIDAVLAAGLARLNEDLLDDGMRRVMQRSSLLGAPPGGPRRDAPACDHDLDRLVASWGSLPKRERGIVLAICEQLVGGTRSE